MPNIQFPGSCSLVNRVRGIKIYLFSKQTITIDLETNIKTDTIDNFFALEYYISRLFYMTNCLVLRAMFKISIKQCICPSSILFSIYDLVQYENNIYLRWVPISKKFSTCFYFCAILSLRDPNNTH